MPCSRLSLNVSLAPNRPRYSSLDRTNVTLYDYAVNSLFVNSLGCSDEPDNRSCLEAARAAARGTTRQEEICGLVVKSLLQ